MAKLRKRFYVAFKYGGARSIIGLRFTPSKYVYQYAYSSIVGPFKSHAEAMDALLLGD